MQKDIAFMSSGMDDRRGSARRKTLKAGKIVFNERKSAFYCTIRNMSETGAKVVLLSTLGLPGIVDLDLEDGTTYACRVARQTLTELGLEFL